MKSKLTKVLHGILGEPVIAHVLRAAREAAATSPISTFVIVCNPRNIEAISGALRSQTGLRFAIQQQALGTADAVASGLLALQADALQTDALDDATILVLCGDAPLLKPASLARLLDAHESKGAAVSVLSGFVPNPHGYGRIVREERNDSERAQDGSDRFIKIVEEREIKDESLRAIREINSGTLAFRGSALRDLLADTPTETNGELYLTRAIELAFARGMTVQAVPAAGDDEVLGINTRAQLAEATTILQRRINAEHMDRGVTILAPETVFIDRAAKIAADTTIGPFAVIEGEVEISEDCRVGPFARIRGPGKLERGATVGSYVELARTNMGAGSRALHLSFLGDLELGADVNVGAGSIFANWDGEKHQRGAVGDKAFVGAGTVVVQPAQLGAGSRTGAGAVVTRTVPPGETWLGVPARPHTPRTDLSARSALSDHPDQTDQADLLDPLDQGAES